LYIEDDEESKTSRLSLLAAKESSVPSPRLLSLEATQPPAAPERHYSEEPKPSPAWSGSVVQQQRALLDANDSVSSQSASISSRSGYESNDSSANTPTEKSDAAFRSFVREVRKSQRATHASVKGRVSANRREKTPDTSNSRQEPSMWSSFVEKVSQAEKAFFDPIPVQRTVEVPQRPISPEHPMDELTDEDNPPPPPNHPPPSLY
jgi:hypothetical protein